MNIKIATPSDRDAPLVLVSILLTELGGVPPPADVMHSVFDHFTDGVDAGFVVIGELGGRAVAVCTVSSLQAMRTRGRFAIIQEMFVEPDARSTGVGMQVLKFELNHAVANGARRWS